MHTDTVGIDLAAQPAGTAVAAMTWHESGARVAEVNIGVTDDGLVAALRHPSAKVGIDCPLGWPTAFVDLVQDHHHDVLAADLAGGSGWSRPYTNRATDLHVRDHVGIIPLSVSADRIGHTALRCAAVLAQARVRGVDVSRDGSGAIAEVYPAAALKVWQLPFRGYKGSGNQAVRHGLVDTLMHAAGWLDLGEHEQVIRASDHALDAVICALVARAVALGTTRPPDTRVAAREGWIHYPTRPLADLRP